MEGIYSILKLILDNNYFTFNEIFYFKQKLGIAMGSRCGPSIANMFIYCYERNWLRIYKPLFYVRFIDDIFIILDEFDKIHFLKNAFGNLKLNISFGEYVNFLDLKISVDKLTRTLIFSLYVKPTNTFCYLSIFSNHPEFIFKNLPKSLFIRLRRICTHIYDFVFYSLKLTDQLLDRGYNLTKINKAFNMVFKLERDKLIEYKTKNIQDKRIVNFKIDFDKNIKNFNKVFQKAINKTAKKFEVFSNLKFRVINKMQLNLNSLLVHNFKLPRSYFSSFIKCEDFNCITCKFATCDVGLNFKNNNFFLPVWDNSNCKSLNCIYVILCNYCNKYYIGQTKNLKKRIYMHIYNIKNFEPFKMNNTSVSIHFNLKQHNYLEDFRFYVYRTNVEQLETRLNIESFLINLFCKLNIKIFNDNIPKLKTIF